MKTIRSMKRPIGILLSLAILMNILLVGSLQVFAVDTVGNYWPGPSPSVATITVNNNVCAPADNLWPDPGFENADPFWAAFTAQSTELSISTDMAYSGTHSLKYSDPADWGSWHYAETHVTVTPHTNYTFGCWMLATDKIQNGRFQIEDGNTGGRQMIMQMQPDALGVWQHFSFTFDSGDWSTVSFVIYAGGGTLYVDNMFLFETSKKTTQMWVTNETPTNTSCYPADNLMANPGMELDDTSWDGWITPSGGKTSFTTEQAHKGTRSLKYADPGSWGAWEYMIAHVPVQVDTEYTLTFWTKSTEYKQAFISLMTEINGDRFGDLKFKTFSSLSESEWTRHSVSFNSGSSDMLVMYLGAGGGVMYFDDFALFEAKKGISPGMIVSDDDPALTNCAPSDNVLTNPGMELDDTSWDGWITPSAGKIGFTTEQAHSGSRSLRYADPGSWGGWEYCIIQVPVKEEMNYTFTFYSKCTEPKQAYLGLLYELGGVRSWPPFKSFAITGDAEWTKHAVEIYTGASTTLVLYLATGGGVTYFDDFALFESSKALSIVEPTVLSVDPLKKSPPTSNAGDNLITNPGLEADPAGNWGTLDQNVVRVTADAEHAHAGSAYLAYDAATGGASSYSREITGLVPFSDYTFSVWVYAPAGGDVSVGLAKDAAGTPLDILPALPDDTSSFFQPPRADHTWYQVGLTFTTGLATSVFVTVENAGGTLYMDDFYMAPVAQAVKETAQVGEAAVMTDIVYSKSEPILDSGNLLNGNAGAESALTDSDWGMDPFGSTGAITRSNATAHSGNYSLRFDAAGETIAKRAVRWVTIEPHKDYMFSLWVKATAYSDLQLSLIDRINYVTIKSSQELADSLAARHWDASIATNPRILPQGYDNQWHRVSVAFHSGDQTQIGILVSGTDGTMYLDDLCLTLTSNAQRPAVPDGSALCPVSTLSPAKKACAVEDNLMGNFNFEGDDLGFWLSGLGYGDNVAVGTEAAAGSNKYLLLSGSAEPHYNHYIKWIDVKPHTEYTFSVYVFGLKKSGATFGLLDSGVDGPHPIGPELEAMFDRKWHLVAFSFNTGVYDRIGFYVNNGGGSLALDNVRLFETTDGTDVPVGETPLPLSPQTGDWIPTLIAVAVVLFLLGGAALFVVRVPKTAK